MVWLPSAFLTKERIHSVGCFHRNLMTSSLQVAMIAGAARIFIDQRDADGKPDPDHYAMIERIRRIGEQILYGDGYSAPFLKAQLPPTDVFLHGLRP